MKTKPYSMLVQESNGKFKGKEWKFETELEAYRYAKENQNKLSKLPCTIWILEKEDGKAEMPIWSFEVSDHDIIRHGYKKERGQRNDQIPH